MVSLPSINVSPGGGFEAGEIREASRAPHLPAIGRTWMFRSARPALKEERRVGVISRSPDLGGMRFVARAYVRRRFGIVARCRTAGL